MKRRTGRNIPWRRMLCVLLILSIAVFLSVQFRPLMLDGACKFVRNAAQEAVNETVCDMLEREETDYNELIRLSCDADGSIRSLEANAAKINRIKAQTTRLVRETLADTAPLCVDVPLGTLCGIALFSGRGPLIPCRFLMSSVPSVGLEYHFDGAGINQTLHSIIMVVTVPLSVTLPLQSADTEVKISFIIGETILVGDVPDNYTNVISDPEVADDIFNYGDIG